MLPSSCRSHLQFCNMVRASQTWPFTSSQLRKSFRMQYHHGSDTSMLATLFWLKALYRSFLASRKEGLHTSMNIWSGDYWAPLPGLSTSLSYTGSLQKYTDSGILVFLISGSRQMQNGVQVFHLIFIVYLSCLLCVSVCATTELHL